MLISTALEGKLVRSSKGEGIIQHASIRKDIYTTEGTYAYACQVRPTWKGEGLIPSDFYTTIYVRAEGE
jgi:hypothetical protein